MEYDVDTLTYSKSVRAASQKYFGKNSAQAYQDTMLHRSPSGAKRKIRQRAEERVSRPSPFLQHAVSNNSAVAQHSVTRLEKNTNSASSSTLASQSVSYSFTPSPASSITSDPPKHSISSYRSLVDSGGYRSILPDLDYAASSDSRIMAAASISASLASLPPILRATTVADRTFASSPPQKTDPTTTSSEHVLIPSSPSTIPVGVKPTVQVHPMCNNSHNSSKGEKPAIPAKPKLLKFNQNSFAYNEKTLDDLYGELRILDLEINANAEYLTQFLAIVSANDNHLANKIKSILQHGNELLRLETTLNLDLEFKSRTHNPADNDEMYSQSTIQRRLVVIKEIRQRNLVREELVSTEAMQYLDGELRHKWLLYNQTAHKLTVEKCVICCKIAELERTKCSEELCNNF